MAFAFNMVPSLSDRWCRRCTARPYRIIAPGRSREIRLNAGWRPGLAREKQGSPRRHRGTEKQQGSTGRHKENHNESVGCARRARKNLLVLRASVVKPCWFKCSPFILANDHGFGYPLQAPARKDFMAYAAARRQELPKAAFRKSASHSPFFGII